MFMWPLEATQAMTVHTDPGCCWTVNPDMGSLVGMDTVAEWPSSTNMAPGGDPDGKRSLRHQCGHWLWQGHRPTMAWGGSPCHLDSGTGSEWHSPQKPTWPEMAAQILGMHVASMWPLMAMWGSRHQHILRLWKDYGLRQGPWQKPRPGCPCSPS